MTQTPTRGSGPGKAPPAPPVPPREAAAPGAARERPAARLRAAATTEPGRLRIIGALLAVLIVAFATATAWQVSTRSTAADNVLNHSAPLSEKAAEIYRSLADADATVTGGFLVGGQQPQAVSDRYQTDITKAANLITEAAANGSASPQARGQIAALNRQLPYYTSLVATAQADNRQGLPVGGAYLRYANQQMSRSDGGLLDAADKLYKAETVRLGHDYGQARALPWTAWVLGLLSLAALVWAQRRHYRRTHRVFNRGMLAASGACAVVLLWLVVGHSVARARLDDSYAHGARSLQVLNNARIGVLQARGEENLTLVARGSGGSYEDQYKAHMAQLAGADPDGVGGELAQARALADDPAGRAPVDKAIAGVRSWRAEHKAARANDDKGDYTTAVAQVIGGKDAAGHEVATTTGQSFDQAVTSLNQAVTQETAEFKRAARDGRGALSLMPAGAGVLGVLGAAGAVSGIGRRLSEYR